MTIFRPCISIISFIDQGLLLCNQRGRPTHLHWNSHLCHFLQQINFFLGLVRLNRILRKWPATSFCKVWQKRSKQWGCQPVISSLFASWFAKNVQFHFFLVQFHGQRKLTQVSITWTSLVSGMISVTQELVKWVYKNLNNKQHSYQNYAVLNIKISFNRREWSRLSWPHALRPSSPAMMDSASIWSKGHQQ